MNRQPIPISRTLTVLLVVCAATTAYGYEIDRFTVAASGACVGGGYELNATIGEPGGSDMLGGPFTLSGGFWIGCVPGDADCDGGLTLGDHTQLIPCLLGPGGGLDFGCGCFDFDLDGDVDLADFAEFQRAFSGTPTRSGTIEGGVITADGTHVTVGLVNTYVSPVVVCSVQYANNTTPVVARVSNVTPTSFDLRLQNPSDQTVAAENVSYLVVEEGIWTVDGVKIEAQKYLSTVTDEDGSWVGEAQSYGQSYIDPVVVGQVMSENDPAWSVFWCQGGTREDPPSPSALATGKTVCEDTNVVRADETVGFIVFEGGHGTLGGVEFEAFLGADTVAGAGDAPPYSYTFGTAFSAAPSVAVTTMAGVNGANGAWAQTHGSTMATATTLYLSVDEDQIGDTERGHTTEQVGYAVFAAPFATSGQPTPPVGACCLFDGSCADDTAAEDCTAQGGTSQGIGSECATVQCPQPEACCYSDGLCLDEFPEDCATAGGTPMGSETDCGTAQCGGACCLSDGSCLNDVTADDCSGQGGVPEGPGTDCATTQCLQPQACCYPDDLCQVELPDDCMAGGGTPMGEGVGCDPNPCTLERVVLGEEFTVTWSPLCEETGMYLSQLMDMYPETFAFVQIHHDDEYATQWAFDRGEFYGLAGYPWMYFDGVMGLPGVYPFEAYESAILARQAVPAEVSISLTGMELGGSTYEITADVCLASYGSAKTMSVYIVQVLDYWPEELPYHRNGFKQAAETQFVALVPGECQEIVQVFTFDGDSMARPNDIKIIAWTQEPEPFAPAEVHQAAIMVWPF